MTKNQNFGNMKAMQHHKGVFLGRLSNICHGSFYQKKKKNSVLNTPQIIEMFCIGSFSYICIVLNTQHSVNTKRNQEAAVLRWFSKQVKACNFIKKRLRHSCFPVNIAKLLRIAFFQDTCVAASKNQIFEKSTSFGILTSV